MWLQCPLVRVSADEQRLIGKASKAPHLAANEGGKPQSESPSCRGCVLVTDLLGCGVVLFGFCDVIWYDIKTTLGLLQLKMCFAFCKYFGISWEMNTYYFCCGGAHENCYGQVLPAVVSAVSEVWPLLCCEALIVQQKINSQIRLIFCMNEKADFLLPLPQFVSCTSSVSEIKLVKLICLDRSKRRKLPGEKKKGTVIRTKWAGQTQEGFDTLSFENGKAKICCDCSVSRLL